ncbi:MAG TPA: NTP transferase domain-containing protein [Pseudolysinimonas sp.]|nr:NTP transferase domain-containing protein [Pseudolysinimonas sp.]
MIYDAIVLAGGRSSRLDGYAKAALQISGRAVLAVTLDAVETARHIAVVGDVAGIKIPEKTRVVRENPPYSGPVAGIAAGLRELEGTEDTDVRVMVLACDMPRVSAAVAVLLAEDAGAQALLAHDGDRDQYLVALVDRPALKAALAHLATERGGLIDASVRQLWSSIGWKSAAVPLGSTRDIDTWEDARELGAELSFHNDAPSPTLRSL